MRLHTQPPTHLPAEAPLSERDALSSEPGHSFVAGGARDQRTATGRSARWWWRQTGSCCQKHGTTRVKPATAPATPKPRPFANSRARLTVPTLAQATLYSSGEPCVMCAGAILEQHRAGGVRHRCGAFAGVPGRAGRTARCRLSCRDVFAASPHPIDCIGPAMLAEASEPHKGSGKSDAHWAHRGF